ncbi:MAG TPA: methyltransferase [Crenalkalicoccus sp.]|nr:methyltransferase [Crenalkalicoccus sp.]
MALVQLAAGCWVTQALHAVAALRVADLMRDGPVPAEALAEAAGANAGALRRVLRALAGLGVFAEDGEGRFALTPMGELLRADAPGSLRPFVLMLGAPEHWRPWGEALHSVRTGEPAFDRVFGSPIFGYHAEHPEFASLFDTGVASRSALEDRAVAAAYRFPEGATVVDVGGGRGTLLLEVLARDPSLRGVLFDQPHVVASAREHLGRDPEIAARCDVVTGDFFQAVPAGAEVYVLKKVVHDWDDGDVRRILASCRRAVRPRGRLLLVEHVVPPGDGPSFNKLLDLLMLVWTGGRERTEAEHAELLAAAGFAVVRTVPTESAVSVIEATAD